MRGTACMPCHALGAMRGSGAEPPRQRIGLAPKQKRGPAGAKRPPFPTGAARRRCYSHAIVETRGGGTARQGSSTDVKRWSHGAPSGSLFFGQPRPLLRVQCEGGVSKRGSKIGGGARASRDAALGGATRLIVTPYYKRSNFWRAGGRLRGLIVTRAGGRNAGGQGGKKTDAYCAKRPKCAHRMLRGVRMLPKGAKRWSIFDSTIGLP